MKTRQIACIAATAALLFAAAAPIASAADYDTHSVELTLHNAKLNTAAGQNRLRRQVAEAARFVCGAAETHDFAAQADMAACRQAAFLQGMSKVDIAIAAAKAGQTPQLLSSNLR